MHCLILEAEITRNKELPEDITKHFLKWKNQIKLLKYIYIASWMMVTFFKLNIAVCMCLLMPRSTLMKFLFFIRGIWEPPPGHYSKYRFILQQNIFALAQGISWVYTSLTRIVVFQTPQIVCPIYFVSFTIPEFI